MSGVIRVDEIEKSSDTGTGIKLKSPLQDSSGNQLISETGAISNVDLSAVDFTSANFANADMSTVNASTFSNDQISGDKIDGGTISNIDEIHTDIMRPSNGSNGTINVPGVSSIRIGPNSSSKYFNIGVYSYSGENDETGIGVTNGNVHLDSAVSYMLYLNWYGGSVTNIGNGSSGYGQIRASAFTVSSDYRIKKNIVPISDGIERLKLLNPIRFEYTEDSLMPNKDVEVDGFLAHEVQSIVPEAVIGEKDAMKVEDGISVPDHQSIDQSKIVPLLTSALQDAIHKIELLEQRIEILENK